MAYLDKTLPCSDCIRPFEFTVAEQELCDELGHNEPVRCPTCRQARDAARITGYAEPPQRLARRAARAVLDTVGRKRG